MQRKLIQLSPSTAVVSLPSRWVKANKLKKGAELNVEESGDSLLISTTGKHHEREIAVDISALSGRMLWHPINEAYTGGYDFITVKTKDAKQASYMTTVARNYHGMIIYEQRNTTVHFRILNDEEMDLGKILHRIFHLNITMLEDAAAAEKSQDWATLAEMKSRDWAINTYLSYCLRYINRHGYTPVTKLGAMHTYIKLLEILTDKICALLVGIGKERLKTQHVPGILAAYRQLYSLHFDFSMKKLILLEEARTDLAKLPKKHEVLAIYITEISELLVDLQEMEVSLHLSTARAIEL
jgi:hypothetical protein